MYPHQKELFRSYDYDSDGILGLDDVIKYLNALDISITIALYSDIIRFGTDSECSLTYQNLENLLKLFR